MVRVSGWIPTGKLCYKHGMSVCRLILLCLLLMGGIPPLACDDLPPLGPIPAEASGPSLDSAAATRAYLATIPPEAKARSDAYFEGGYWLLLWSTLLSVGVCLLLLFSGWSAAWRSWAERVVRARFLRNALYALIFTVVFAALNFPLSVYQDFFREHQYGMATQTFGAWLADQLKGLGFLAIIIALLLPALYAAFRRAPRTWWLWGSLVLIGFSAVGSVVGPVLIAPRFNEFKPLEDPAVRDPILAMAQANQIPGAHVYMVDASRQTKRISAFVSGGFGVASISLNDNLLQRCSLPEIRQVMAHEMGHYVLNHVYKLLLESAVLTVVGAFFVKLVFDALLRRFGARWRVEGIADPAAFPVLVLIISVAGLLGTPVNNNIVREVESEADAFGINTSREPDGMAQASIKLGEYRKMDPGPVEEFVFFDHPSGRARIRMAMDWKAAHLPAGGEPGGLPTSTPP